MAASTLVVILLNLALISALFWLFDFQYRRYRVDLLRHRLFRARDELFDTAARGAIQFDDPAYFITRQMLNGMIRFAHELGLWRFVVLHLARRQFNRTDDYREFSARYEEALERLSPEGRKAVDKAMLEAHFCVLSHVLHTSILTFPIMLAVQLVVRPAVRFRSQTSRWIDNALTASARRELDEVAYYAGETC